MTTTETNGDIFEPIVVVFYIYLLFCNGHIIFVDLFFYICDDTPRVNQSGLLRNNSYKVVRQHNSCRMVR